MMNTYADNISLSMENSRNCLRRIARNDDTEFSKQSILNVMEKFVKSVNAMDETILVPCRLMDLKVGDEQEPAAKQHGAVAKPHKPTIEHILNSADLFDIYNMLNSIKADLQWGQLQTPDEEPLSKHSAKSTGGASTSIASTSANLSAPAPLAAPKGHARRPSTVSVSSTNSSASCISDSESEVGNENDSGIEESAQDSAERVQQAAQNFRRHLHGLSRSLRQMTEAAEYLTIRYQHNIGSPI